MTEELQYVLRDLNSLEKSLRRSQDREHIRKLALIQKRVKSLIAQTKIEKTEK